MKHPSTLAFYGAVMIIIVQVFRSFLYDLFGFFFQILNYFLILIDLFGMALIANFFYRLHLQHKNDSQKPQNEFKE
jgi:hypothetical protein